MSLKKFIQKENVNILWEVIIDEESFQFLNKTEKQNIYQIFLNNLERFYETEKNKSKTLMELNKKYILFILNYIKKTFGDKTPSKIHIQEEIIPEQTNINMEIKELVTNEDIKNDRKTKFQNDFNRRQEEFQEYMTLKTPEPLDFNDKQKDDGPIKEMDKLLKEMQEQRNYEIENINRTYNNTTQVDNWLKPQETSLKNEKKAGGYDDDSTIKTNDNNNNGKRFRFLDSTLEEKPKTVTWDNQDIMIESNSSNQNDANIDTTNHDTSEDTILFSRLKKLPTDENPRILQLEKDIKDINNKLDKIFELLSLSTFQKEDKN